MQRKQETSRSDEMDRITLCLAVCFPDGRGGTFGLRVVVLKDKCRRRVKAKISDGLHVNANQPLNPDDLDITLGHLVSNWIAK